LTYYQLHFQSLHRSYCTGIWESCTSTFYTLNGPILW